MPSNKEIDRLVEKIIDSMVDGNLELPYVAQELCREIRRRARVAEKERDDYTYEELMFWRIAARDAERLASLCWPKVEGR